MLKYSSIGWWYILTMGYYRAMKMSKLQLYAIMFMALTNSKVDIKIKNRQN